MFCVPYWRTDIRMKGLKPHVRSAECSGAATICLILLCKLQIFICYLFPSHLKHTNKIIDDHLPLVSVTRNRTCRATKQGMFRPELWGRVSWLYTAKHYSLVGLFGFGSVSHVCSQGDASRHRLSSSAHLLTLALLTRNPLQQSTPAPSLNCGGESGADAGWPWWKPKRTRVLITFPSQ